MTVGVCVRMGLMAYPVALLPYTVVFQNVPPGSNGKNLKAANIKSFTAGLPAGAPVCFTGF